MIDPRPYAQGRLAETYTSYPHLGPILPAVGYYPEQLRDLEATINAVPADVVVSATPFSLGRLIKIDKPLVQVAYEIVRERGAAAVGRRAPVPARARASAAASRFEATPG